MKIGNSTIQFNCTIKRYTPNGQKCTLLNVPYWKLYAREGDAVGKGWFSAVVLTYEEIVNWLTTCNKHRVLEAYPRFSTTTRHTHFANYCKSTNEFILTDKYTGEVLYIVNATTGKTKYTSPDYKQHAHLWKKFFCKRDKKLSFTQLAHSLMCKN